MAAQTIGGACKVCGTQNASGERYCMECGAILKVVAGETVSLWFYDSAINSDKVYHLYLEAAGAERYTVRARWGRRGKGCQEQVKATAVPLAHARRVYDDLIAAKIKKGYEVATGRV